MKTIQHSRGLQTGLVGNEVTLAKIAMEENTIQIHLLWKVG